jgi:large subunit ribosomal protein L6
MKILNLTEKLEVPDGAQAELDGKLLKLKGPKGEVQRKFVIPKLELSLEGNSLMITAKKATRREKTLAGTLKAHIKNMFKGVTEGHVYKLKICSGHFPMNVSLSGGNISVKNFLGEKVPRVVKIREGADVKLDGEFITVESTDIEKAGQVAADIEQLTRVTDKDIRIFQDGIYIIEKPKRSMM